MKKRQGEKKQKFVPLVRCICAQGTVVPFRKTQGGQKIAPCLSVQNNQWTVL